MYLYVSATGKHWRLGYRFAGKQKTLRSASTLPSRSLKLHSAGREHANISRYFQDLIDRKR